MQPVFTPLNVTKSIFCSSLWIKQKKQKPHIILHKRKLKDCCHNSPQFSAGSFYYQRRWIIISTPAIPNNTILQHHCLLCFMAEYRWERKNIQMKHYPVLRCAIAFIVQWRDSSAALANMEKWWENCSLKACGCCITVQLVPLFLNEENRVQEDE